MRMSRARTNVTVFRVKRTFLFLLLLAIGGCDAAERGPSMRVQEGAEGGEPTAPVGATQVPGPQEREVEAPDAVEAIFPVVTACSPCIGSGFSQEPPAESQCIPGSSVCVDGEIVACSSVGEVLAATPCAHHQTCVEGGGDAWCQDWVCQPGTDCAGDTAVYCAADGLTILTVTSCAADTLCEASSCETEAGCVTTPLPDGAPCGEGLSCLQGVCQGEVCGGGPCSSAGSDCDGDGDCDEGQLCMPFSSDEVFGAIETLCSVVDEDGTKEVGEPCTGDVECGSGYCVTSELLDGSFCWGACKEDSDCPSDLYCYPNMYYFAFGTDTATPQDDSLYGVPTCLPYIGSFEPCQWHSDCAWEEWCEPFMNQSGTGYDHFCVLG